MAPKGQLGLELFPGPLDTPAFRAAWQAWLDDRRERRLPRYTARARALQVDRLAAMGEPAAIAAIEWSIAQAYKGIFPPPAAAATKARPSTTWELKTRLETTLIRIRQLESRSPGEHCSLQDFLSREELAELASLRAAAKSIRQRLLETPS